MSLGSVRREPLCSCTRQTCAQVNYSVSHRWYRTNDTYNVCYTSFESATLIQVYIEEKYVNEVKKSRRVTAADLVANIGEHKKRQV